MKPKNRRWAKNYVADNKFTTEDARQLLMSFQKNATKTEREEHSLINPVLNKQGVYDIFWGAFKLGKMEKRAMSFNTLEIILLEFQNYLNYEKPRDITGLNF